MSLPYLKYFNGFSFLLAVKTFQSSQPGLLKAKHNVALDYASKSLAYQPSLLLSVL